MRCQLDFDFLKKMCVIAASPAEFLLPLTGLASERVPTDMIVFNYRPWGGAIGAMLWYVMCMFMEKLCTKFHFIKDNKIEEISCFTAFVACPADRIVTHLCKVSVCTIFTSLVAIQFSIEKVFPVKCIRPCLQKFDN